jgi:hypothetical protein
LLIAAPSSKAEPPAPGADVASNYSTAAEMGGGGGAPIGAGPHTGEFGAERRPKILPGG